MISIHENDTGINNNDDNDDEYNNHTAIDYDCRLIILDIGVIVCAGISL